MSDEKIVWKIVTSVSLKDLEDTLNKLVEEGYQLHSKDMVLGSLGSSGFLEAYWVLFAFDPALLGAKYAHAQAAAMGFGPDVPGPYIKAP